MDFSIAPRIGYLEIKLSGRPTPEGFIKYFDALFAHDDWEPGISALTDNTNLDVRKVTVEDVMNIAKICTQRKSELGKTRNAILVANDLQYGMVRMWGAFVEGEWDIESALFRSMDEALAWLSVKKRL